MSARIIAVYSLKGGVGKTTLAVNLAWASAALSGHRTLLWDLDAQAAATFMLAGDHAPKQRAEDAIRKSLDPAKLVLPTAVPGLEMLPADASLRALDVTFHELDKKRRLAKIADELAAKRDRVIIDCPPGLTDTSEQILRAADLVVVPVIPSALARRALEAIEQHMADKKGLAVPLLPVFSMVDRRRSLHREALAANPGVAAMPMASAFEAMSERRAPLGTFAPRGSGGVKAVADAWDQVETALGSSGKA